MARSFNGSSAYLHVTSAVVIAEPLTMACWFRRSNSATGAMMSIGTNAGANRWQMDVNVAAGVPRANSTTSGFTFSASATAAAALNTWAHACAVFTGTNSRTIYLNGANSATDTNTLSITGVDRTLIGCRISTTPGLFFAGDQADVAVWSVALTAAEIASMATGVRPIFIRPESLVFYNPLDDRWTYDRARGLFLTDVGPSGAAEDPPFFQRPRRKYFLFGDTAAPASVIFRNRTGSRSRLIA